MANHMYDAGKKLIADVMAEQARMQREQAGFARLTDVQRQVRKRRGAIELQKLILETPIMSPQLMRRFLAKPLTDWDIDDEPQPELELAYTNEPVIGWRAWKTIPFEMRDGTVETRLAAVSGGMFYPPRERMAAVCDRDGPWGDVAPRHEAPWRDCSCGVWALHDRQAIEQHLASFSRATVFGTVKLWGHVLQFEKGYRGQYAYPDELYVIAGSTGEPSARELSELYGVPVKIVKDPRPPNSMRGGGKTTFMSNAMMQQLASDMAKAEEQAILFGNTVVKAGQVFSLTTANVSSTSELVPVTGDLAEELGLDFATAISVDVATDSAVFVRADVDAAIAAAQRNRAWKPTVMFFDEVAHIADAMLKPPKPGPPRFRPTFRDTIKQSRRKKRGR
jgi:hypothetical protein